MVDFGRRPRGHIGDRSKKKIGTTLNKMSVCYRHPPAQIFCYHLLIEDDTFRSSKLYESFPFYDDRKLFSDRGISLVSVILSLSFLLDLQWTLENRNDWKPIDAWQVGRRWITVDYTPSSIKSVGQSPLEQLYIYPGLQPDRTFYIYIWTELRKPNILIDDVHLNRVESFDNVIQCQRNSSKTLSWRDSVIHQVHHHEIRCRKWTFRLILYKTLSTPVSKKKKSTWWVYFEILSIFPPTGQH